MNTLDQQFGMGARQYSSLLGRFLEVDPVLGGNANDYAYVSDPVGMSDLDGNWGWSWKDIRRVGRHSGRRANQAVRFGRNWSNGSTQIGLGYGIASGGRCRLNRQEIMIVCSGAKRFTARGGTTIGGVFVTPQGKVTPRLMAHEGKHSDQWSFLGPMMPITYAAGEISRVGRNPGCNPLEWTANLKDGGYKPC